MAELRQTDVEVYRDAHIGIVIGDCIRARAAIENVRACATFDRVVVDAAKYGVVAGCATDVERIRGEADLARVKGLHIDDAAPHGSTKRPSAGFHVPDVITAVSARPQQRVVPRATVILKFR